MDIVMYALSKNPYLSVAEKEDHVDWFRMYFKERESLLLESLSADFVVFDDSKRDPSAVHKPHRHTVPSYLKQLEASEW